MSANGQQPGPSPRVERFLRAVLPIGLGLLVLWVASVVAALTIGGEVFSISPGTALVGLTTCICLIASGTFYRRDLDRRHRGRQ